uniref:Apple domain-containing protein n=1 Tax=Elaeophora elaphi TaxID=1147741 RepID=A0A0R3RJJ1_9BILA
RTIRLKERKTEKVEKVSESAEVTQTDNPEEPIITSALDTFTSLQDKRQLRLDPQFMKMTCVVVFEIDPQADKANFKAQDSVKVDRADHCAYLCYRDACTAAIFTPATAAGSKGTCERQFNIAEKCNSTLRREYYYKTTKPIYLQCFRCLSEKPQTKSPFDEITSETPLIPSKKHSFEITNVDQAEAGEELVKTTLVPDVELNTVEVESKETEKDFGTTAFDATNGNTKTSDVAEEIKNETEDASPVETSQTTPAAFAETGSETNEQPQAFTENAIDVTDDDSKTSTSTHTGTENTEMTTSESLIGSFISDTTFESNSATTEIESGTEIFGLMSSNDAAVEHENEFTKENKLVHAASSTIQAFDSVLQSTAESEEFNLLHESTTEASVHTDVLSSESESKIKSDGTGSTGVESTSGEAIETPAAVEDEKKTGTVVKDENSIEQFSSSTVMSGSMHAGNTEFKKDPEDDRNTIEAKSSDEQGASEGHTVSVHIDESTTASHGQDEATESSHFSAATNKASSKERTKNDPLSSKDVAEAFHTYLQVIDVIGCIITFQADPHSKRPAESSTGFQASTIAKTAEVCAGRCYQVYFNECQPLIKFPVKKKVLCKYKYYSNGTEDGCTGARYDPSSKECVLGYSGKHICNNGPEHFLYRANETIWIHCTGCKLYKPGDQDFNISIYSPKTKAAKNTEIKDTVVGDKTTLFTSEAQKVKSIETAEVAVTKSGVTSDESTPEAEKSLEHIMEGAVTETSISPSPPSSLPSSLAATEEEGISIEAMKISTTTEEEATIVVHTMEKKSEEELSDPISTTVERTEDSVSEDEASFTSVPLQSTLFGHDCTLLFQARPIDIHFKEPNSEMIPAGATSTVADCAKHCYMVCN